MTTPNPNPTPTPTPAAAANQPKPAQVAIAQPPQPPKDDKRVAEPSEPKALATPELSEADKKKAEEKAKATKEAAAKVPEAAQPLQSQVAQVTQQPTSQSGHGVTKYESTDPSPKGDASVGAGPTNAGLPLNTRNPHPVHQTGVTLPGNV